MSQRRKSLFQNLRAKTSTLCLLVIINSVYIEEIDSLCEFVSFFETMLDLLLCTLDTNELLDDSNFIIIIFLTASSPASFNCVLVLHLEAELVLLPILDLETLLILIAYRELSLFFTNSADFSLNDKSLFKFENSFVTKTPPVCW